VLDLAKEGGFSNPPDQGGQECPPSLRKGTRPYECGGE
jgi:hypothetical protein